MACMVTWLEPGPATRKWHWGCVVGSGHPSSSLQKQQLLLRSHAPGSGAQRPMDARRPRRLRPSWHCLMRSPPEATKEVSAALLGTAWRTGGSSGNIYPGEERESGIRRASAPVSEALLHRRKGESLEWLHSEGNTGRGQGGRCEERLEQLRVGGGGGGHLTQVCAAPLP